VGNGKLVKDAGANDYLEKTFDKKHLPDIIAVNFVSIFSCKIIIPHLPCQEEYNPKSIKSGKGALNFSIIH